MSQELLWVIGVLGAGTLVGTFYRMRGGFGPPNLRALGLVLIAVFASLLAIGNSENFTAAMGILGAIAGYLFGAKSSEAEDAAASGAIGVNAQGAQIGGNAKIAGRDINETVNNIERMLADVQSLANATVNNLQIMGAERRPGALFQKRQEHLRWNAEESSAYDLLQSIPRSSNLWSQKWIEICLEEPACRRAIRAEISRNEKLGWRANSIDFDNTNDGLHFNITFEKEIDLSTEQE
jgi:hypothetical protein